MPERQISHVSTPYGKFDHAQAGAGPPAISIHRIRSLTLTSCDVHDDWPPPAMVPLLTTAEDGKLADLGRARLADTDFARQSFAVGYEHPQRLCEETIRTYLSPQLRNNEASALFARMFLEMDNRQTTAIEPGLRALRAPTLIVWGEDDIFKAPSRSFRKSALANSSSRFENSGRPPECARIQPKEGVV